MIDWTDYEINDPGAADPPDRLGRAEAERLFRRRMDAKGARIAMLGRLLKANGVELGTDDSSIQKLNDWFSASVEADPQRPGQPTPAWQSVAHDVSLFLGEVMIERHPQLHWEFFTWGKTNVAYQRAVIMGLSTEDPTLHTSIDIDGMVAGYTHRIVAARGSIPVYGFVEVRGVKIDVDSIAEDHRSRDVDTRQFLRWLRIAAERA